MRIPATILATLFVGATAASLSVTAQTATNGQDHEQHHPATSAPAAPAAAATQKPPMPPMAADAGQMADMMARMHANDAKLDQLVAKMRSAQGAAKTDAIAELLTALVDDRKNMCEPMMAHMMSMMKTPAPASTRPTAPAAPVTPAK